MEKIFVTGGTGFIGSHLVKELVRKGHSVRVLVRANSSLRFIFRYNIEIKKGDIRNFEEVLNAMEGCDVVFHNAALARDWGKRKDFFDINVKGTENILKAAKINKVNYIILTSTTAVLGEENCLKPKPEESPYKPKYSYFLSKLWESDMNYYRYTKMLAEKKAIKFCRENNISLVVIRPVWVYGPREFHAGPYYFCKSILQGIRILPGCKTNKFHVIYVKDLVKTMMKILEKRLQGITIFNIGAEYIPTMDEFRRLFCKYLNRKPPIYLPKFLVYPLGLFMEAFYKLLGIKTPPLLTRARVVMNYCSNVYDISKVKKEIGFGAKTSLEEGIKTTIRWWRMNKYL